MSEESSGFYNDAGLSRIADVLQIGSFLMNVGQLQNEDIMNALDYQNLNYLEAIVDNQQTILEKLKNIEKKYANKTDQQSMMMKSNEMMAVYKQYKINPICGKINNI